MSQVRLLALARLKLEHKPSVIAKELPIAYSSVLSLKKQLEQAKDTEALLNLFNLDKIALDALLDNVRLDLQTIIDPKTTETVIGELVDKLTVTEELSQELSTTALQLTRSIKTAALTTNDPHTIVFLCKSLAELNNSFFPKMANLHITKDKSDWTKWLTD